MALSTLDAYAAGAQPPRGFLKVAPATLEAIGVLHSLLYTQGEPGAGSAPSPGVAGEALTSLTGALPFTNPVSGHTRLARFEFGSTVAGRLYLVDRLWHNSGLAPTTTTAQSVNSAAWPARDRDGSTNGAGVLVGIEVSSATSNGSAVTNSTLLYTNSAGTDTRTGTMPSFPATAVAGTFVPFLLQAGDVGVRSVQSVTLGTSYGGGAIHLVAYRVIASIGLTLANTGAERDAIGLGFPRLYDNSCLTLLWRPSATTAPTIDGQVVWSQG